MKKQIAVLMAGLGFAQIGWSLTAPEIVAKVEAKYANLSSLAVEGRVVSDIDLSGADASRLLPAGVPQTDEAKRALQQPRTLVTTFTVRLARPNWYRIEWAQTVHPSYTNEGVAWSSGAGHHLRMGEKTWPTQSDLDMALATATGVSGGVAHTMPSIFFQRPGSFLKALKNFTLLPEEKIGADDCQVISGEMAGQKYIFWITKDFLVKQRRQVLGNEMAMPQLSDDEIRKTLNQLNQPATPEVIAQMKTTMQTMKAVTSKAKGSITETYEKIELNPPVKKAEFETASSPGIKP